MRKKPYYRWQKDSLLLELYIQTRARKNMIANQREERLKIAITATPSENKANEVLIKFLAKYFAVPQNKIKIIRGSNSRYKSILIANPKNHLGEFKK